MKHNELMKEIKLAYTVYTTKVGHDVDFDGFLAGYIARSSKDIQEEVAEKINLLKEENGDK